MTNLKKTTKKDRFKPSWPDDPRADGLFVPDHSMEKRSPHPPSPPSKVLEILARGKDRNIDHPQSFSKALTHCNPLVNLSNELAANFSKFAKLPPELRMMIWRFSCARLVEIFFDTETGCYKSTSKPPVILGVSKEARSVALDYYELSFSTTLAPGMIYFEFGMDELYVGAGNLHSPGVDITSTFFNSIHPSILPRITSLCIDREIEHVFQHLKYADEDEDADENDDEDGPKLRYYGLVNLDSLTIISDAESLDIVLHEVRDNFGEFQAWKSREDGEVIPWMLPTESVANLGEGGVSCFWRDLENDKHFGDLQEVSLKTARLVSRSILQHEKRWSKRMQLLDNCTFAPGSGCLYPSNDILKTLIDWHHSDEFRYTLMGLEMNSTNDNNDPTMQLSPIGVFLAQNDCCCRVEHVKSFTQDELEALTKPDLPDLGTAVQKVKAATGG